MTSTIFRWSDADADERNRLLTRPAIRDDAQLRRDAANIVSQVRTGGDRALRALTRDLDGVDMNEFRVAEAEFAAAEATLSAESVAAIDVAIHNVQAFHEQQLPRPIDIETMPGVRCERIPQALDAVGLYVPAGSAPLPSTAIMLCVPARIAGCPQRILCTPPRQDGTADEAVLVAAKRAGVDTVFKIGGAQAVAAMAYGTETIKQVAKIFGPGNAWVTAAKTLVAMDPCGATIDMPAGPSEVLVIADESADAAFVASDLLSQAEHGEDSQVILVTTSADTAAAVVAETRRQIQTLSRRRIAEAAIGQSRFIVAADLDEAVAISNRYAPEHLIIHVDRPRDLLPDIRSAGSVFLGPWSPESVGDYCSGTNHVLPTYGAARSYSGLSVDQFMRHMTVQELSRDGLRGIAGTVTELARLEGLDAHAAAVQRRFSRSGQETP